MTIFAQYKREIQSLFVSPIVYVLLVATMIYNGFVFLLIVDFLASPGAPAGAAMQYMFGGTSFFYIIITAACSFITMRLIAAEKSFGTLETLLTAPINETQVVVAKYAAALSFYLILWLPTLAYPLILSRYSEIDFGPLASGYLGTLGIGMMFLAIGLLSSAVSKNQIVAALLSFAGNMVLLLLGVFAFLQSNSSSESLLGYLNLWDHMDAFSRGIVDTRYLVYYASTTLFVLFCTVQVLQFRRWKS